MSPDPGLRSPSGNMGSTGESLAPMLPRPATHPFTTSIISSGYDITVALCIGILQAGVHTYALKKAMTKDNRMKLGFLD